MDGISLTMLAEEQLEAARSSPAGRAAHTIHGGHDHMLRQTLIALTGGAELAEHNSPGQATLQMTVRPEYTNGHGICHGGYIFLLADTAFAYSCNSYNLRAVAAGGQTAC